MNSAEVIVFSGVPQTYTYSFTDQENYPIGCHVKIQLGQKECDGLIIKKGINEKKIPLKPIICLNEKKPILSKDLIDLMGWFQDYYHTTPYKAYQVVIGKRSLRKVEKINKHPIKETEFKLTIEQKKAVKEINNYYGYKEIVIHGITGSGKTEIYLQVAKKVIENKKNVIILVPEIALTPQFFAIFEARFGKRLALLHSGLTKKQKDIEWSKIYNEEVDIVLGPRSAIFAPFKNLGLIILDECHDSAYKQEQHPRYDTYTVAKYRCKTHEALLINGSATPQIELKYTSEEKGKSLIELNTRVNKKPLPNIQIVDMLQEEETNQ
ncbi:MAG: DEAD/DEAH box helicase, partial [bacterium]